MLHQLRTSVLQHEILESLSRAAASGRQDGWLTLTGIMATRGSHLPHSVIGMVQRRLAYRRSVDALKRQGLVELRTIPGQDEHMIVARITNLGQSYLDTQLRISA